MKELSKNDRNMVETTLQESQANKKSFAEIFIFYCYFLYEGVSVVFQYPGSKQKMKDELIYIYEKLYLEKLHRTGSGFKIFIDGFVGGMNSTFVLMDSLILSGIEKIIVNDINPCIARVHYDIRNNSEALILEFIEIIRIKYFIENGSIFLPLETYKKIHTELSEEFMQLQKERKFGVRTSILFLILHGAMYSGIPGYDNSEDAESTDFKFNPKVYEEYRYLSVLFNQIPKIREFSKICNQIDIEIRNQDFFEILEEFKGNPDVFFNLDVPYVDEVLDEIDDETLSNMTSSDLDDCGVDYNQRFDHLKIVNELQNINFIYNNNAHPILKFYADKFDIELEPFTRNEISGTRENKETKKVKEFILFKNSLLQESSNTNNTNYCPSKLVA